MAQLFDTMLPQAKNTRDALFFLSFSLYFSLSLSLSALNILPRPLFHFLSTLCSISYVPYIGGTGWKKRGITSGRLSSEPKVVAWEERRKAVIVSLARLVLRTDEKKGKPRNGIHVIIKCVEREKSSLFLSSIFSLTLLLLSPSDSLTHCHWTLLFSYWAKEWENHEAVTYSFLRLFFFEQVDGVRKNPPERIVNLTRKPSSSSSFHHLFTFIHVRHKWWESRESFWERMERERKGRGRKEEEKRKGRERRSVPLHLFIEWYDEDLFTRIPSSFRVVRSRESLLKIQDHNLLFVSPSTASNEKDGGNH